MLHHNLDSLKVERCYFVITGCLLIPIRVAIMIVLFLGKLLDEISLDNSLLTHSLQGTEKRG